MGVNSKSHTRLKTIHDIRHQSTNSELLLFGKFLKSESKSDITSIENSHLVVCGPQIIWKGNTQELRHFTSDVLKLTGKWKSPGGDVKMFTASDEKFVFKWQGSKKKKIEIVKVMMMTF